MRCKNKNTEQYNTNFIFIFDSRNEDKSMSSVTMRAIDSVSSTENLADGFYDLNDVIEKLEIDSLNKSSSFSAAPIQPVSGPSFGDLLHLNIT